MRPTSRGSASARPRASCQQPFPTSPGQEWSRLWRRRRARRRRCARRRSGQAASSRPAGIVGPRPGRGDGCSVFSYAARVLTFRAGRVRPCSVGRLRCDRRGAGLSRLRVSGLRSRGRDCQCLPSRCRSLSARASLTVGNRVDTCGGGRAATSFTDRAESVTSLARGTAPFGPDPRRRPCDANRHTKKVYKF